MKKILALLCCSVLALGCGCSDSEESNLKLYDNPLISFEYPDNIEIKERKSYIDADVDKETIILYISEKQGLYPSKRSKQVEELTNQGFICDIKEFGDNKWICSESGDKKIYYYFHQKGHYSIQIRSVYEPESKIIKNILSSASFDFDLHKKKNALDSDFGLQIDTNKFLSDEALEACKEIVNICDDVIDEHLEPEYCIEEFDKYNTIVQSARIDDDKSTLDYIKFLCDRIKSEIERENRNNNSIFISDEFKESLTEYRNKLANYIGVAEREIN